MKRILILSFFITIFLCFSSCDSEEKNISSPADHSTDLSTDSNKSHTTSREIYEGLPFEANEIVLPKDGEKIIYSPALILFSDEQSDKKLEVISAERNGNLITFYTTETQYYYDPLGITIVIAQTEMFSGLNGIKQDDGTYRYETYLFESDKLLQSFNSNAEAYLGDAYDIEKSYYYVNNFFVYEDDKK